MLPFHIAEGVQQALAAVSECNDAGTMVIFDSVNGHAGSKMIAVNSEAGRAIRSLVKKATGTPIHRVKNSYIAKFWIESEDGTTSTSHFTRPGK